MRESQNMRFDSWLFAAKCFTDAPIPALRWQPRTQAAPRDPDT